MPCRRCDTFMPVPNSVGRPLKKLDPAKLRNYPGRGGVPVGSHALGATALARFKVVPDHGFDSIESGLRLAVASQLARLPEKNFLASSFACVNEKTVRPSGSRASSAAPSAS